LRHQAVLSLRCVSIALVRRGDADKGYWSHGYYARNYRQASNGAMSRDIR